jgi:acyl carrier protein
MSRVMKTIVSFLSKNGKYKINENDDLFLLGYLDSMGILELIAIIEDETGSEFEPEFFMAENFKTIKIIQDLIEGND